MSKKQPDPSEVAEYFILDSGIREVAGQKVAPGQKSVNVTHRDAEFFVAGGGLSLIDPVEADKAAKEEADKANRGTGKPKAD